MRKEALWNEQLDRLSQQLIILADKPEETVEVTLKALWLMAAENPQSAEVAAGFQLPFLAKDQDLKLQDLVGKRLSGIPLAYLTGRQQFMGVELLAGSGALIPRKETEILGQVALDILQQRAKQQDKTTLIDVCTGAGNLMVSLAVKVPQVTGYAADLSPDAVALARKNVAFHQLDNRVEVREGDLLSPFDTVDFHHQVDLLICNPPYISTIRVAEMPTEISAYEPRLAFDGGAFGIKILNALMKEASRFLKPDGWLAFEIGLGQGEAIVKRMKKSYHNVQTAADDNGNIRVVMAQV